MLKKYINLFYVSVFIFVCLGVTTQKAFADNFLPFSNLFAFGDSLSDVGNVSGAPYTNRNINNSASIWVNDLGNDFGWNVSSSSSGGYDFAQAGAVTGNLGFDTHSTAKTMQEQVNNFISESGGRVDKNALYSVWAGGNDIKDYFQYGMLNIAPQQLIANSTGNTVNIVNELHQAGAKYIMVFNVPNFADAPVVNHNPIFKMFKSQIYTLIQAYNTQLLASMNATGDNVIQIDMAGLFNAIQTNYAKFGFSGPLSEVSCNPLTGLVCSDPNSGIFFYDGFHPSQETHRIAADYILSVLEAPEFNAFLGESPLTVMNTQNKQIQSELSTIQSGLVKVNSGHWHVFTSGAYSSTHRDSEGPVNPGYHQNGTAFTVGADYRVNDNFLFGVAVGRSMGKVEDSNSTSNFQFDLDENLVNVFGGLQFWNNKAYLNGSLGFGYIDDSNIHRNFMLGSFPEMVDGHTTSDHYDANIMAGYNFEFLNQQLKTGPIASLEFQRVSVNPYAEKSNNFELDGESFDALQYHAQNYDSFVGGLGWQVSYTGVINNVKVMPYLQATYNHEMIDGNTVEAGLTSLPGSYFSLPVGLPFKDYGLFSGGIQSEFNNGLVMSLGYNAMAGHKYLSQNVMLNLSIPFQ